MEKEGANETVILPLHYNEDLNRTYRRTGFYWGQTTFYYSSSEKNIIE
ncbi:MAG: hypothetical protein UV71_C0014G0009 [Microgenomates group bacterium GW2011_GWC1_43_13]|nr:MAG: hypothetical protein UV71_C0014G0009 [Microgenomates group bacterium GW2011_GWC1_43_13]